MNYKIEFRALATLEVIEAHDWYELQREGLGHEFLDAVEMFLNTLQINPEIYSYYEAPVRQGSLARFPYTVVYEIFEKTIVVYSVFMEKQSPDKKRTK
jgi:toxin ParE1/3/4